MTSEQIWQAVLGEIELSLSRANFVTWFKDTFISSFENDRIIVCVPNAFVKKWLEEKYHKNILSALESVTKQKIQEIIYKIELRRGPVPILMVDRPEDKEEDGGSANKQEKRTAVSNNNPNGPAPVSGTVNQHGLNPRYVFENFIVGRGNELAHAACLAVVENLGKSYNPLFIYGGVGLGKTHLLQAIGNAVAKNTNKKILYATSEKFTNNYIQAVKSGKAKEFKNLYRNVDLFLVDDVQFMGGKDGTQEEFFHTFNELQQNDKQIVLTSDRPPKSIPAIESRLISRFESGMVADVGKPDIETKIAILEKAIEKGCPLDREILAYIGEHVQNNIRELEGALIKVIASHQFKGLTPNLKSVKEILSDYVSNIKVKSLTPKEIVEAAAKFYNTTYKDLIGKSRKKELVWPRQVAIFLIREDIGTSYPSIGAELGGRDHTTAMHSYTKISHEIKELGNEKVKQELNSIRQLFNSSY